MPVELDTWLGDTRRRVSEKGLKGLFSSLYYVYAGAFLMLSKHCGFGTNIFDLEWDVCIILDACRVDAITSVTEDYSFLADAEAVWSVGSTSEEWLSFTFTKEHLSTIENTVYVSANPHVDAVLRDHLSIPINIALPIGPVTYPTVDAEDLLNLNQVNKKGFDEMLQCVPPRAVTDSAITDARNRTSDRMIVHYMQPHVPHIGDVHGLGSDVFDRLQRGEISRSQAWSSYIENLRLVLEEVELLLQNMDAQTVLITADHGEGFGRWGFYSHPIASPMPDIRRVPIIRTRAKDHRTHIPRPTSANPTESDETTLQQQLEALGYRRE